MGGGSSSSNTTTQNFTDASTVNASQAGSAAGVVGDDNTTIVSILDGSAIARAFGFGDKSLDVLNDSVTNSLDFSESVVDSGFEFGRQSLDFSEEALSQSYEFGAGSLDDAFDFARDTAEQSSLENRAILNSAINASNGAQSSVLKFAQNVSTPQIQLIKAGLIGLAIFATASILLKRGAA